MNFAGRPLKLHKERKSDDGGGGRGQENTKLVKGKGFDFLLVLLQMEASLLSINNEFLIIFFLISPATCLSPRVQFNSRSCGPVEQKLLTYIKTPRITLQSKGSFNYAKRVYQIIIPRNYPPFFSFQFFLSSTSSSFMLHAVLRVS